MELREWVSTFRSYAGTMPRQCVTVSSPWSMTLNASIRVPSETILARHRLSEGRLLREPGGRIVLLLGWVRDWSFVGLSIRYSTGPLVGLSGLFCPRMLFRMSCLFPVEDQVGWILQFRFPVVTQIGRILWLKNIFGIGGICWLKRIPKAGVGSLFPRTSLKSSSGINN
jgi:hypothetical protein